MLPWIWIHGSAPASIGLKQQSEDKQKHERSKQHLKISDKTQKKKRVLRDEEFPMTVLQVPVCSLVLLAFLSEQDDVPVHYM